MPSRFIGRARGDKEPPSPTTATPDNVIPGKPSPLSSDGYKDPTKCTDINVKCNIMWCSGGWPDKMPVCYVWLPVSKVQVDNKLMKQVMKQAVNLIPNNNIIN